MTEKTAIESTPYTEMDSKDENQILAELKGEFLETFVYQYQNGSRTVTSLSYIGVKEAIRRRGNFQITDYKIEETPEKYRAIVKVHDCLNNIDVLGASEADKTKPFAYVLAINKAERNAFAKVIPAKYFAELIAEKLKAKSVEVIAPQPKPEQSTEDAPLLYRLNAEIPPMIATQLEIEETDAEIVIHYKQQLPKEDWVTVTKAVEKFGGKWDKPSGTWGIPLK